MQKVPNLELQVVSLSVAKANLRNIRGHWVLLWAADLRCHQPYCYLHMYCYVSKSYNKHYY